MRKDSLAVVNKEATKTELETAVETVVEHLKTLPDGAIAIEVLNKFLKRG